MTKTRGAFVVLFSVLTLYLVPGVFNSSWANLKLISGFPPPLSYSVYEHPVSLNNSIQPIHNDYEKALALARAQNKPLADRLHRMGLRELPQDGRKHLDRSGSSSIDAGKVCGSVLVCG
jgi:hypothetical protein